MEINPNEYPDRYTNMGDLAAKDVKIINLQNRIAVLEEKIQELENTIIEAMEERP